MSLSWIFWEADQLDQNSLLCKEKLILKSSVSSLLSILGCNSYSKTSFYWEAHSCYFAYLKWVFHHDAFALWVSFRAMSLRQLHIHELPKELNIILLTSSFSCCSWYDSWMWSIVYNRISHQHKLLCTWCSQAQNRLSQFDLHSLNPHWYWQ